MQGDNSSLTPFVKNQTQLRTLEVPVYPSRRATSSDRFSFNPKPVSYSNFSPLSSSPETNPKISAEQPPLQIERRIELPSTLTEAQTKIVSLSADMDKVNTMNYKLVKENELLRISGNRSDRDRDMENKLAIVLAENEKLIQVVEELHDVYMKEKAANRLSNNSEKRIEDLVRQVEQRKQGKQEEDFGTNNLMKKINELEADKAKLYRQISDNLESIRSGATVVDKRYSGNELNDLMVRNSALMRENEKLKKELEIQAIKDGEITALKMRAKENESTISRLIRENEELSAMYKQRVSMNREQLSRGVTENLEFDAGSYREVNLYRTPVREINTNSRNYLSVEPKRSPRFERSVEELVDDSEKLNDIVGDQLKERKQLKDKIEVLTTENKRLSDLVSEKTMTIELLKYEQDKSKKDFSVNSQLNELIIKKEKETMDQKGRIEYLIEEKKKLEEILAEKRRKSEAMRAEKEDTSSVQAQLKQEKERSNEISRLAFFEKSDLQAKINALSEENKRLEKALQEKTLALESSRSGQERITSRNFEQNLPAYHGNDQYGAALNQKQSEVMMIKLSLGMIADELESLERIKSEINSKMRRSGSADVGSERVNSFMDRNNREINQYYSPDPYMIGGGAISGDRYSNSNAESSYRALGSESANRYGRHAENESPVRNYGETEKRSLYQVDQYSSPSLNYGRTTYESTGTLGFNEDHVQSSNLEGYRSTIPPLEVSKKIAGSETGESPFISTGSTLNLHKGDGGYQLSATTAYATDRNSQGFGSTENLWKQRGAAAGDQYAYLSPENVGGEITKRSNNTEENYTETPRQHQADLSPYSIGVSTARAGTAAGQGNAAGYEVIVESNLEYKRDSANPTPSFGANQSFASSNLEFLPKTAEEILKVKEEMQAEISKLKQEKERLALVIQRNDNFELEKVRTELKSSERGDVQGKWSVNVLPEQTQKPDQSGVETTAATNLKLSGAVDNESNNKNRSPSRRLDNLFVPKQGDQTPYSPGGSKKNAIQAHTTDFEILMHQNIGRDEIETPGGTRWIKALETENKRLNGLVEKKDGEMKELIEKNQELELTKAELTHAQTEIEEMSVTINYLRKEIEEKEKVIQSFIPITMGEEDTRRELNILESENKELRQVLEKKENELRRLSTQTQAHEEIFTPNNMNNIKGVISPINGKDSLFEEIRRSNPNADHKDVETTNSSIGALIRSPLGGKDAKSQMGALENQGKKLRELLENAQQEQDSKSEGSEEALLSDTKSEILRLKQENERFAKLIEENGGDLKAIRKEFRSTDKSSEAVKAAYQEIEEAKKTIAGLVDENIKLNVVLEDNGIVVAEQDMMMTKRSMSLDEAFDVKDIVKIEKEVEKQMDALKKEFEEKGINKESLEVIEQHQRESKQKLIALVHERKQLKETIQANEKEIVRLNELLVEQNAEKKEKEIEETKKNLSKLREVNEELQDQVEEKSGQIMIMKKTIETKDKAIESLKASIVEVKEEEMKKTETLKVENLRLSGVIMTQGEELESRRELEKKLDLVKISEDLNSIQKGVVDRGEEVARLQSLVDEKQEEVETLKAELEEKSKIGEDIKVFESEMKKFENMVEILVGENERLKGLLSEKMQLVKKLKTEKRKLRKKNSQALEDTEEEMSMSESSPTSRKQLDILDLVKYQGNDQEAILAIETLKGEIVRLVNEAEVRVKDIEELAEEVEEKKKEMAINREKAEQTENICEKLAEEIEERKKELAVNKEMQKESEKIREKLVKEVEEKKKELTVHKEKVQEAEKKNEKLVEEVKQTKRELAMNIEMQEEAERIRERLVEENELNTSQIEDLKKSRGDFERQNSLLKDEVASIQEGASKSLESEKQKLQKMLEKQKKDADEKINRLSAEIGRVQSHLNRTLMELQEERRRFSELEVLRAQEIDSIRQQYEAFERDEADLPGQLEAERAVYEMQLEQIQNSLMDAEKENESLREENRELQQVNARRVKEVDELKKQIKAMEEKYKADIAEIKKRMGSIQTNNKEVDQLAKSHKADKVIDQAQIATLQKMNDNYRAEADKLKISVEEHKKKFWDITQQYNALKHMHESLKLESHEKAIESEQRLERLHLLEREVVELEHLKDEYKRKAEGVKQ